MATHRCYIWGFATYWTFDNGWGAAVAHSNDLNGQRIQIAAMPAYLFGEAHVNAFAEYRDKAKFLTIHSDVALVIELNRIMTLPPYDNSANEMLLKLMKRNE